MTPDITYVVAHHTISLYVQHSTTVLFSDSMVNIM